MLAALAYPVTFNENVAAAQVYTELYKMDFDTVDTVTDTTDETAFNEVYGETAELLSPRTTFKYSIASKSGGSDKYLQMDSDYASNVSGFSALHIWLPDGGFKANNGTYKISYDFKWLAGGNKPFLRLKTNHSTKEGLAADAVIAGNGGIYNWGPMLSGVAPISDTGTRDQSAANMYGTYSTYEGTENVGWFTASWNNDDKVNMAADEWHTAETMIDTVNNKAYYYFDNIYVGCQEGNTFGTNLICGPTNTAKSMQIQIEQGWNVGNGFQLDNIIISHADGAFDGSDKIKVDKVELIDCTGEREELGAAEINAIADKLELSISNIVNAADITGRVTLTKGSSPVAISESYLAADAKSGILTVTTDDYLENGAVYTLKAFDKEYTFTVSYPKQLAVGTLEIKKQNAVVTDIAELGVGDVVSADITVLNPTEEDGEITLAAACYDKDKLVSFFFKDIEFSATEMAVADSLEFVVPTAAALNIKLFAADSMGNFGAIADCYELGTPAETTDQEVFETGVTDKAIAGKRITALMYKPGKTAGDLIANTDMSDVVHMVLQQTADASGKYLFKIGFDGTETSGAYKTYVNSGEITEGRYYHLNETENEIAVGTLIGSSDFVADAKLNAAALGFGEFTDNVPDEAYNILKEYYSANTVSAADFDKNRAAARKSELMACVNAGQIDNIFEYSTYLADELADIAGFMTKSYFSEALQTAITADIKNNELKKISDLNSCINECFTLNLIKNSNGYENLTPVLKAFAGDIGVDSADITNAVSKKINGKDYADYRALRSGIEGALTPTTQGGGGLGGGFGGGGGTSSPGGSGNLGGISATGTGTQDGDAAKEIPGNIFVDVPDDFWGRDAIVYLTERGVLNGKSKTEFCPEDYVTREEFTKMIVAAFCEESEVGEINFSDVKKGEWYYNYIAIAYAEEIIMGYEDLTFGIGHNIIRQDMAVILNRVAAVYNYNFTMPEYVERFDDDKDIADYAVEAVYSLRDAGVVKGDGSNFNPNAFATRAEAATIIYNMLTL